jgi:GNAT superfamily N-acetyltransferase
MWDRFDSRGLVDMDEHGRYLKARRLAVRYLQAAAARYKDKKTVKTQDGDEMTVYEYSDRQIANRNRQKAERVEKLRKTIKDLRKQVQKDLKSEDEHTRMVALAVGLMDATYERVGNDESAKEGHFGVTGWKVKHLTLGKDKATIKYVGKSGVKHEKVIDSPGSLTALREAVKGKKDNDEICGGVKAEDVNAYLKPFDVTAKDIRGYHANTEMQTRLKAVRGKGGKLPEDKKEREKKLKEEFKKALEETAEAVGHEPATLKSQYLVPGLEDDFLKDGTVDAKLDKRGSTPKLLVERNNLRVTVEPDNGQFTTHSSAYVFLANTKEDANAGYLILVPSPRDGGYWYVGNVYVDPLFRRQGLSKLLHDTAYAWATRYGGSFRSGMITSPENRSYWEKLEQAGKAESYDAGPGDIQYKRTKTSNHSGDPELNAWVEEYLRRHPKVRPFLRDRVWHVTHPGAGNHPEARYTSRGIEIYPKFWNLAEDPRDFVFTHEVGHSVLDRWGLRQFIAAAEAAGVDVWDTAQLPFSNGNMHEAFADSFASYFLDGDVRHRYPVWVPLVEEGMKRGKTASVSAAAVRSFGEQVEQDLGLESFDLYLTQQGDIQLNLLVVGKAARKQGVGTEAMSLLCRFADQQGARVVLSPALRDDRKGTTSRSRLVQFYKRFGFVENKGRHVDFSLSAGMYRNPALRREANTWPPGVFLHGTSERFDRFRPGRHHAIYLSQPKGRKTQAEYISEGPRGGWLAEVAVDFQKGKIFNPYQDPLAEEIRLRVMGSNPDPTDKRIPYEEAPDIIREASPYGYTIFRFYERSVRDESIAVMDLSLLKILRWHKVDR